MNPTSTVCAPEYVQAQLVVGLLSTLARMVLVPALKTTTSVPVGKPLKVTVFTSSGYWKPCAIAVLFVVRYSEDIAVVLVTVVVIFSRSLKPIPALMAPSPNSAVPSVVAV